MRFPLLLVKFSIRHALNALKPKPLSGKVIGAISEL